MQIGASQGIAAYIRDREATRPEGEGRIGREFAGIARDFATTLQEGEATAMQAMTSDADPHSLVQALAQTELAVETAVTIRNPRLAVKPALGMWLQVEVRNDVVGCHVISL